MGINYEGTSDPKGDLLEHTARIPTLRLNLKNEALDIIVNSLEEYRFSMLDAGVSDIDQLISLISNFKESAKKRRGDDCRITVCCHAIKPFKEPKR